MLESIENFTLLLGIPAAMLVPVGTITGRVGREIANCCAVSRGDQAREPTRRLSDSRGHLPPHLLLTCFPLINFLGDCLAFDGIPLVTGQVEITLVV